MARGVRGTERSVGFGVRWGVLWMVDTPVGGVEASVLAIVEVFFDRTGVLCVGDGKDAEEYMRELGVLGPPPAPPMPSPPSLSLLRCRRGETF